MKTKIQSKPSKSKHRKKSIKWVSIREKGDVRKILSKKQTEKEIKEISECAAFDCVPIDIMQYNYTRLMVGDFNKNIDLIIKNDVLNKEEIFNVLEKIKEFIVDRQKEIKNEPQ